MRKFYKKNRDNINKIFYFLLFLSFLHVFFNYLISYLAPFVFGYMLCVILYPLSKFLQSKLKFSNGIASFISIIIFILIISALSTSIIYRIIVEAGLFFENVPIYMEETLLIVEKLNKELDYLLTLLPDGLQESWSTINKELISSLTSVLGSGVKTGSVGIVKKLPNIIMIIVLGFVSAFFLIRDKKNIEAFINRQITDEVRNQIRVMKQGLSDALAGYVKAQFILMLIAATICIIGLTILRYPYALFIGLLISFVDALPIFGSGAILWPWAAFSLASGNYKQAVGLLIIYLIVIAARQTLEPRVLGKQIGIHPVITLMSIYIGLKVFGVLGFILGPVTVVIIKAFQKADLLPRFK